MNREGRKVCASLFDMKTDNLLLEFWFIVLL